MNSIPQIIQGYSREYNFAVRELELEAWAVEGKFFHQKLKDIIHIKRKTAQLMMPQGTKVYMTL